MDDLDHSIHIAENDWMSFCEESEECSLLKPSIARPDSSGLSDSEDSETSRPEQRSKSPTGEEQDEKSLCSVCSAGNTPITPEVHVKSTEETNITGLTDKLKNNVRHLGAGVDNSRNDPGPPFSDQAGLNGNEPQATEAALSRVSGSAEKERWFVTVNDRPARQQAAASSVKRKTRPKQPYKNSWSSKQETSVENALEMMRDTNDYEGKSDKTGFVQLNEILVQKAGETSAKINHELPQTWHKTEAVSETLLTTNPLMEHVTEPTMGRNTHEPGSASRDAFGLEAPSHVEAAETDQLDFCSIPSCYLSAAGSTEEPLYQLKDQVTEEQQLLSATSRLLNTRQDGGLSYRDDALSCNASPTECDGSEWFCVGPIPSADRMPDDNAACVKDAHSTELCVPSHTHTLQNPQTRLSASGGSSGHRLSPDLPGTPCSATSGAGARAEAAGLTGPVYAISAFWNKMEELTINDILRLRMGRRTQTGEPPPPSVRSVRADSAEQDRTDAGTTDTSDVADSGYFTQPDESKPDCSSCEFSTSDFEEEYWHFIGASRNPSPDPQGTNRPSTTGSAFLSHEELLCTCSEGKDPRVSSEDCAGQGLDHHESHTLMKPSHWGEITKTQTFNPEEITSGSMLGNDENTVFLSHSKALEENLALNNCLETLRPAPVLSSTDLLDRRYQISIPEVFEYFFTEDEAKNETCGEAYNPEDISVTPDCTAQRDCTLCNFGNDTTFSHCTVGELTFPKPNHLLLNGHCEDGDISPAPPQSFTQADDCEAGESRTWKTLLSIRKICFHTKESTWCRRSGAWVIPVEKRKGRPSAAITEGGAHWRIWERLHTTGQEGVFSTLQQSDMCLVCIAFASWVLRSYNPEAADAWKAALLANVSALSAIQFLRHYVKKTPRRDDP